MEFVHYQNIQSSLLRFCQEFGSTHQLATINLDAHTDDSLWPKSDFIGLSEFRIDIMETYEGACMFGLSTREDTNLFRMGELTTQLTAHLLPGKTIPACNAQTGDVIGLIYILRGTRVGAPVPTKTQPILPVAVRFSTDLLSA